MAHQRGGEGGLAGTVSGRSTAFYICMPLHSGAERQRPRHHAYRRSMRRVSDRAVGANDSLVYLQSVIAGGRPGGRHDGTVLGFQGDGSGGYEHLRSQGSAARHHRCFSFDGFAGGPPADGSH
jgi:hypothetical protein